MPTKLPTAETLAFLRTARCSAILRTDDRERARQAMAAAVRGGFRVVEFTFTIPGALELIAEFSARDELVVGAGTVMTKAQARDAVAAGASFLVSPVVDPVVIAAARELGVVAVPGTSTPTEMWTADQAGAQIVKLFPAAEKGPEFVRACLGPMPHLRIFPTSGITEANAVAYLDAGAFAVGFVAALFRAEDLSQGRFDSVQERAARMVGLVQEWSRHETR